MSASPDVTCAPGSWLAVAGSGCWALVELAADDPRTALTLAAAERDDPIDELLDVMISQGLRRLPGFAIVGWDDERLRYVVRPPALVEAVSPGSPGRRQRIAEVTSGSWRDGLLDDVPARIALSAPAQAGGGEVPLVPGGVAAGRVVIDLAPEPRAAASARAVLEPAEPEPAMDLVGYTVDRSALSERLEATPPGPASAPPLAPPAAAPPSGPAGPPGIIDGVPWAGSSSGSPPPAPPPSRWAPPTPPPTPPPPRFSPDQLPPPTPQAAVPGPPAPPPTTPPTTPPTAPPPPPLGPPSGPPPGPTGTRKRADLLRELAQTPPTPTGPTVWAVVCPNGHLTPAYAAVCRVCATLLPEEQTPVEVARPPLGRLVLSSGGAITLDRDAVFGRAPSSTATDPAERPHLVKLADSGEISRRHAEVHIDGWVVLVRDLGSANGTTLTLPGGVIQQLRAQEDYPLEPGAVVTLAGGVSFTFEIPGTPS